MKAFRYAEPRTVDEAVRLLAATPGARAIAGGQDLLTQMKAGIESPPLLVSLARIEPLHAIAPLPCDKGGDGGGGIEIGAQVALDRIAQDPVIKTRFPVLAQAAASVATPQIRALGTIGGNLCQRPRCWYFRCADVTCLRKGGRSCLAHDGENRYHAIFANSQCAIVHPSDTAPALVALDATVALRGPRGARTLPIGEFFALPSRHIDRETELLPAEVVESVRIPASPPGTRSTYLKVREKDSFDFALVSATIVLSVAGGKVARARIALGGVAPVPWRSAKAEAALVGGSPDADAAVRAGRAAVDGATPLSQNAYKVHLLSGVVTRAIRIAAGLDTDAAGGAR